MRDLRVDLGWILLGELSEEHPLVGYQRKERRLVVFPMAFRSWTLVVG